MTKFCRLAATFAFTAALLPSCSNIDCPLDSIVAMTCRLESTTGKAPFVALDVRALALGKDTLVANSLTPESKNFLVPLRHSAQADTLMLDFTLINGEKRTDSLMISHTNEPHFEALDCPAAMFHRLTGIRAAGTVVDSARIIRTDVTYEDVTHVKIYLPSAR